MELDTIQLEIILKISKNAIITFHDIIISKIENKYSVLLDDNKKIKKIRGR